MEADIRHQQYTLFYSGMAVLFFGIWGILKLCIKFYHNPITIDPELLDPGEDAQFALLLLILLYVALIAIDSIIRLYIGLCAVSEGRGRWKHSVYLVITAVYLIVNILLSYSTLVDIFDWDMFVNDPHFFEETLTTTIIDLSCNLTFVLILIASVKLRYLAKKSRDLNAESNKTVTGNN